MVRLPTAKLYDVAAAVPLMAWYGLAIRGLGPQVAHQWMALAEGFALRPALSAAAQTATLLFLGLQIVLFLIRRLPEAKAEGIAPRLAAIVGGNLQLAFLALPLVQRSPAVTIASLVLVVLGTGGAVYAAGSLGRSFSVFPQARALIVHGPYRYVRHPLYLTEQIATVGTVLQFAQPWALLIGAASLAAQFPRMHYEEEILAKTYPGYAAYAARTKRLIPGIY